MILADFSGEQPKVRIVDSDTEWCKDYANVLDLAEHLNDEGHFDDTKAMLYFFSKPWKWSAEWREYQESKATV